MFDLGPHAGFIVGSYAVTALVVVVLVAYAVAAQLNARRTLSELESRRGSRRRSGAAS